MYNETIYRPTKKGNGLFNVISAGVSLCDETYDISRTNSNMYIFEYVLNGSGTVKVNDVVFQPIAGDVYILPKHSNHHYYAHSLEPWKKIWFTANGSLIPELLSTYPLSNTYHIPAAWQKNLFSGFLNGAKDGFIGGSDKSILLFHELCINLSQIFISPHRLVSVVAKQIKDYIDKNINEPISLTEISKSVYRSPSQVIRSFKKAYGVTPYQYITEERLKTAKMLLTNHSYLTIQEVAFQMNFADEHYFSNYFKNKTGMSPSQYRKQKV